MRNSLAGKIKYIKDNLGNAQKIMGVSIDDSNAGINRILKLNTDKIEYQEDLTGEGVGYGTNTWIDATRPTNPSENIRGYNTERKRIEFYILAENQWYYKWQGKMDLESPTPAPSLFQDNFEEGWFINNIFIKITEDNFATGWQIKNIFTELFNEDFQTNWFIYNILNQVYTENFESEDWQL